jgi:sulfide:quinone oxidoreductase
MLNVLVAGGGVAALEAVLALQALGRERVSVTLLAPSRDFVQKPASVLSPFSGEAAPRVPLDQLPATCRRGALAAVDPERREVRTTDGDLIGYDRLIVATGARPGNGVPGATTFRGPISAGAVEAALRGARERALFTLPPESAWTLPLYELALLAARDLRDGAELAIVTPEPRPLDVFGRHGSDAIARLLDRAGVDFIGNTVATEFLGHALLTAGGRLIGADAVVSMVRLDGPYVEGLPADADGFLPVDANARVVGVADVFAAGDATDAPIKQGGLATQQADAAAEAIAAEAGAPITPQPCRRVLRAELLTGDAPLFLSRDLDDPEAPTGVSRSQLWWPSGKLAGRYLTSFLEAGDETLSDRPKRRRGRHAGQARRPGAASLAGERRGGGGNNSGA